jgi:hypothetical protein
MSFGRIFSLNGCYWNVAAVEVDSTGQVNAEAASGVSVGSTGGQGDFVRGAIVAGEANDRNQPSEFPRVIATRSMSICESDLSRSAKVEFYFAYTAVSAGSSFVRFSIPR